MFTVISLVTTVAVEAVVVLCSGPAGGYALSVRGMATGQVH